MAAPPTDPPKAPPNDAPSDAPSDAPQGPGGRDGEIARLVDEIEQLTRSAGPRRAVAGFTAAGRAMERVFAAYAADPAAAALAQTDLFARQARVLALLSPPPGEAPLADGDAPSAQDIAVELHRVSADWAEEAALSAPGVALIDRRRAAFFIRQSAAAASPSNFLGGNRRALDAFASTGGESLARGLALLRDDLASGRLGPPQSEPGAFRLGVDLAATPGEVVFANELIELLRYHPTTREVRERPLLIFPPWINKFYVLDLRGENSLVAWLRDQGFTVYLVSWRSAGPEIADFGWEAYFTLAGRAALDWVTWAHGAPANAAGYCVGGVLLAALAARLAEEGDPRLASASLLAAQTDFSEPGDLGLFMDEDTLASIEALIGASGGVMPGEAMREAFDLLRPAELIWKYAEERYLLGRPAPAFDLLHWNGDQTNIPGPLHLHALRELYRDNALARGRFSVEGRPVDLSSIAAPVFLQASLRDHISPAASVLKAARLLSCEVTAIVCDSGHIAGVVNPPSAGKYRYWAGDPGAARRLSLGAWLDEAGETPGSWWPMWADWLHARSGGWRPPPPPDPDAPPAPGAYVLETLDDIRPRFRTPQGGARG